MKKLVLFAAIVGLGLVSAHPPEQSGERPREARGGYPPCSATVTDRCIQLYERGVATRRNLARNARLPRATEMAGGGARAYPPCSATRKDECRQERRLARHARRIRMAGERG